MVYSSPSPSSSLVAAKSPWKTQNSSATISLRFNHYRERNISTHLTIFSSSDPSSSSYCHTGSSSSSTQEKRSPKTAARELHGNDSPNCSVFLDKKKKKENKITGLAEKAITAPIKLRKIRSIMLLNVTAFVYASDIPVLKEVEAFMDPATFCAVRFATSAIPFLPFVIQARSDVKTRNAGMELGLWVSLGHLAEALGLLSSEAGRASFLSLFTVIVVPILESMLGSIVPTRTWFGILMSVLGILMLECSGCPPNVGDLLNFLSAIFFGIHMLRTRHISRSTKREKFLALLGYEVLVVAMVSSIWCLIEGSSNSGHDFWDWMLIFPWIPALYTGVISTGLCMWAEIDAMRDISATESAMILGMEPVWGAGFAWFLLGERWGVTGWIGAALILGGSLTVQVFGSIVDSSKEGSTKNDTLMVPKDQKLQNGLTASPLVVRSREDVRDML